VTTISARAAQLPALSTNRFMLPSGLAAVAAALALCGCGGAEMAPVSGKITIEGQPVGPGTVIFEPDASAGTTGPPSVGNFGPDGLYSLTTASHGEGAVVGRHRVTIQSTGPGGYGDETPVDPATAIPARYSSASESGLMAEVKSGSNPSIDFDLEVEP
jgi:hypothetical protein